MYERAFCLRAKNTLPLPTRRAAISPQGGEITVNKYEIMFVIDADLDEAKRNEVVETVKGIIAEGGEVGEMAEWGLRKFAYPIEKKNEGYYFVLQFCANPELPKDLDRRCRNAEPIVRHIIVNKDEK